MESASGCEWMWGVDVFVFFFCVFFCGFAVFFCLISILVGMVGEVLFCYDWIRFVLCFFSGHGLLPPTYGV